MNKSISQSFLIFVMFLFFTQIPSFGQASKNSNDWANFKKYAADNKKLESLLLTEKRIVFMGNSITEFWKVTDSSFFAGRPYINRGISGQTTPQMLLRFRKDIIELNPAVVVILAGINDIAENTGPITIEDIFGNIVSMAQLAKANKINIVLSSVLPAYDFPWRLGMEPAEKIVKLNNMIRIYAQQNNIVYLDYYSAMVDERKGLDKKYTNDGVHPTLAGYKVMETLAEKAINKALTGIDIINSQSSQKNLEFIGPQNGKLVIVGGGSGIDSILKVFIKLAGGNDAPIVFIPTADGSESYDQNSGAAGTMRKLGATNISILHTTDRNVANSESFVKPLLNARAVWFGGGRQWRLVDSYKNTLTEKMLWKVLERGGVIGGTSAGATIQGSYLTRGDTKNNMVLMGDHQEGFGFIKNTAIDQHVLVRNRQFDMFEILSEHPQLLGIGIDENTAIVVQGNQFEVIGKSYVIVYDGSFWSREGNDLKNNSNTIKPFYFLRSGDKYNLKSRKVNEEKKQ